MYYIYHFINIEKYINRIAVAKVAKNQHSTVINKARNITFLPFSSQDLSEIHDSIPHLADEV